MLRALIWKEWQEQRWMLLVATICAPIISFIAMQIGPLSHVSDFMGFFVVVITVPFIAIRTLTDERRNRTLELLERLPIRASGVAFAKVFFGAAIFMLPFAVAATGWFLTRWGASVSLDPNQPVLMPILASNLLICYLLIICLSAKSASMPHIIILSVLILLVGFTAGFVSAAEALSNAGNIFLRIVTPMLFDTSGQGIGWIITARFFVVIVLAFVACARLSAARSFDGQAATPPISALIGAKLPRSSDFVLRALIWKTLRDIGILSIAALLVDLTFSFVLCMVSVSSDHKRFSASQFFDDMLSVTFVIWFIIGSVLAIALGNRLVFADKSRDSDDFWRTQPIRPSTYFCAKVIVATFLLALPASLLMFLMVVRLGGESREVLFSFLTLEIWTQVMLLIMAFFLGSLLKRPLLAAIVSAGCAMLFMVFVVPILSMAWLQTPQPLWLAVLLACVVSIGAACIAGFKWIATSSRAEPDGFAL